MPKTILILGNGFDLAHDLPTRYSDFLRFCQDIDDIFFSNDEYDIINGYRTSRIIKNYFNSYDEFKDNIYIKEINNCISSNIWYNYFQHIYKHKMIRGENWIDFESEISDVIQFLDKNCKTLSYSFSDINFEKDNMPPGFESKSIKLRELVKEYFMTNKPIRKLRKLLYDDLSRLSYALRIYLLNFVENLEIKTFSPDLKNLQIDYVLNFNYTNTFQSIYKSKAEIFHIHGNCQNDENNLVLGIDEYWSESERNHHTDYTIFKKFAQRIQKRTGKQHYDFLLSLKSDNIKSKVYVFGHSLAETDKDILEMFLADDDFEVTIFCKDKETEGEYIANMIKICSEKQLIERVNNIYPSIEFVIQQPMKSIENEHKKLASVK